MAEIAKRTVFLASGKEVVQDYPIGTVFIIIGDTRAGLTASRFPGYLLVSSPPDRTHLVFSLDFVPLDPLDTLAPDNECGWHIEIPKEFRFFTVMREPDAREHLKSFYSEWDALGLLLAVNDMESLDALAVNPDWSRYEGERNVFGEDFDASLAKRTGYVDKYKSAGQAVRTMVQFDGIPIGRDGAAAFEDWCHQVVKLLFRGRFDPIYLKPNGSAASRRDIVATNLGERVFCERILHDYDARHVVFEVKNSSEIDVDALRQIGAYTGKNYGRIGFLIYRSVGEGLDARGRWHFRNMYNQGTVVVCLSTAFLLKALGMVARCDERCAIEREFVMLLDRYLLEYANEPQSGAATT
jgi:hypothetical protein